MLTPAFDLSQNEELLTISIQVPYAKISEVEVHFEDNDFMFYSKPYYLRLHLPGKLLYQEEPSIKYDFDKRIFTIQAPKAQKGEVFEGLDLLTVLLAKKKVKAPAAPLIQVIDGCDDETKEDDGELDWTIEQISSKDEFGVFTFHGQQCGFGRAYSFSVFDLEEEASELFEVIEPQKKTTKMRTEERLATEAKLFSEDHYIADLYHDEDIQPLIKYKPVWDRICEEMENNQITPDEKVDFTSKEKEYLRKLPTKEFLLDKRQVKSAFLGLIDILFAYAYNKRTTEEENTVMSGWTMNRLSATLSWLEEFSSVQEVAITCIRRSLIYPLYRHFELSLTVLEDVAKIMKLGRKYVIKCLLEIRELFFENEPRYILNDLYITDYSVWVQTKRCSSATFLSLAEALEKVLLTKGDIGLNLVDRETFAEIAWMSSENLLNSTKDKKKEYKAFMGSAQSKNSNESAIASGLEKLSLESKDNNEEKNELSASDSDDDSYEIGSSYSSDSIDSCSSVCASDCSSEDSDEDWETDSDDSSSSDNNSFSCLLRKETSSERIL